MTVSISARDAGVRFLFDREGRTITPLLTHVKRTGGESWAWRHVSFHVQAGESVALLGPSGAGKTTLLRTVAGVLKPDEGHIDVTGQVGSLLSIEAGVMAGLTGRENSLLLSVLAGMTREEARAQVEAVKAQSGLGPQFERPVATYSQGMRARLGFTVAERAGAEILVLDEVHEALDHEFRARVERRAREIRDAGGIVVAAGHDHRLLERLCGRAMYLDAGQLHADGEFTAVQQAYLGPE